MLNKYLAAGASLVYVGLLVGGVYVGYRVGAGDVQERWDEERRIALEAQLDEGARALETSWELARLASEENRKALERAVRASEERQAARVAQAVRSAALESATRQGAYVSSECVLDEEVFEKLQEQLK